MKLTNHNKNNRYDVDTFVMGGTITMTQAEWKKARNYVLMRYELAKKSFNTYIRDSINTDRLLTLNSGVFSIGVVATGLIAHKFNLKGLRKQNYAIKII